MDNPLRDLGVSDADLEQAVLASAEVITEKRKKAKEMVAFAKSISPIRTGKYAASIKVTETKTGKTKVAATAWYAHIVEYGSGPDTKQGSPFGPDTPTPEFAVMAKTAAAFGGTSDGQAGEGR
jgi:hypothetical protein